MVARRDEQSAGVVLLCPVPFHWLFDPIIQIPVGNFH
jgi:hypothetical protein